MFDQILSFSVTYLPTLLAVVFILVPTKGEDRARHMKWRIGLFAFAVLFGALSMWQQSRAAIQATRDREGAIIETSSRVSKDVSESVSKSVGDQYARTISQLHGEIGTLQAQLAAQGKSVDQIKGSNFVSGKEPVKVEVTNAGSRYSRGIDRLCRTGSVSNASGDKRVRFA